MTLTCPECGRVGTDTMNWVKPTIASGVINTGLDPLNCDGCRKVLNEQGYAVLAFHPAPGGGFTATPA